jgi:hypothetical protein
MSTDPADTTPPRPRPTVFLSYAAADRQAAQSLRDALPSYGLEVWYDESGLSGGDAWDQKIRRQIRDCDFFMPLISAQTEARAEGYFRREWRLAVERTLDMADDHTFLLPVVIDGTSEAGARVPDRFLTVQWTRLPGGKPTPALEALCRRLVSGETAAPQTPRRTPSASVPASRPPSAPAYPPFPQQEPGQKARFGFHILGWALQCAWLSFKRLPRIVRLLVYLWVFALVLAKACSPSDRHAAKVSHADADTISQIANNYQGSANKADVAKLGSQIAAEITGKMGAGTPPRNDVLAIPFSAPSNDQAAKKLADSTFAQAYGKVAVSHDGRVGHVDEALSSPDTSAAVARGRERHAKYVFYGAADSAGGAPSLTVWIVRVADGSVLWSASYPVAGANSNSIATELDSKLQSLEDE